MVSFSRGSRLSCGEAVHYEQIKGQATTLQRSNSPIAQEIRKTLEACGFAIKTTDSIDGWLQYHAVFIACMSQAILAHEGNAVKLGCDKEAMRLLCKAITQGFA